MGIAIVSCRTKTSIAMKDAYSILTTSAPYWIFNDLGN